MQVGVEIKRMRVTKDSSLLNLLRFIQSEDSGGGERILVMKEIQQSSLVEELVAHSKIEEATCEADMVVAKLLEIIKNNVHQPMVEKFALHLLQRFPVNQEFSFSLSIFEWLSHLIVQARSDQSAHGLCQSALFYWRVQHTECILQSLAQLRDGSYLSSLSLQVGLRVVTNDIHFAQNTALVGVLSSLLTTCNCATNSNRFKQPLIAQSALQLVGDLAATAKVRSHSPILYSRDITVMQVLVDFLTFLRIESTQSHELDYAEYEVMGSVHYFLQESFNLGEKDMTEAVFFETARSNSDSFELIVFICEIILRLGLPSQGVVSLLLKGKTVNPSPRGSIKHMTHGFVNRLINACFVMIRNCTCARGQGSTTSCSAASSLNTLRLLVAHHQFVEERVLEKFMQTTHFPCCALSLDLMFEIIEKRTPSTSCSSEETNKCRMALTVVESIVSYRLSCYQGLLDKWQPIAPLIPRLIWLLTTCDYGTIEASRLLKTILTTNNEELLKCAPENWCDEWFTMLSDGINSFATSFTLPTELVKVYDTLGTYSMSLDQTLEHLRTISAWPDSSSLQLVGGGEPQDNFVKQLHGYIKAYTRCERTREGPVSRSTVKFLKICIELAKHRQLPRLFFASTHGQYLETNRLRRRITINTQHEQSPADSLECRTVSRMLSFILKTKIERFRYYRDSPQLFRDCHNMIRNGDDEVKLMVMDSLALLFQVEKYRCLEVSSSADAYVGDLTMHAVFQAIELLGNPSQMLARNCQQIKVAVQDLMINTKCSITLRKARNLLFEADEKTELFLFLCYGRTFPQHFCNKRSPLLFFSSDLLKVLAQVRTF